MNFWQAIERIGKTTGNALEYVGTKTSAFLEWVGALVSGCSTTPPNTPGNVEEIRITPPPAPPQDQNDRSAWATWITAMRAYAGYASGARTYNQDVRDSLARQKAEEKAKGKRFSDGIWWFVRLVFFLGLLGLVVFSIVTTIHKIGAVFGEKWGVPIFFIIMSYFLAMIGKKIAVFAGGVLVGLLTFGPLHQMRVADQTVSGGYRYAAASRESSAFDFILAAILAVIVLTVGGYAWFAANQNKYVVAGMIVLHLLGWATGEKADERIWGPLQTKIGKFIASPIAWILILVVLIGGGIYTNPEEVLQKVAGWGINMHDPNSVGMQWLAFLIAAVLIFFGLRWGLKKKK